MRRWELSSSWPAPSCRVHLAIRPDTKQKHQAGRAQPATTDKRAPLEGAHRFGGKWVSLKLCQSSFLQMPVMCAVGTRDISIQHATGGPAAYVYNSPANIGR